MASRYLIDLPSAPSSRPFADPSLGLAPYVGTLFSPAMRFVGDAPPYSPAVAIVGTRRADPEAVAFTRTLACSLAGAGVVVVSGGALGIDAAAHEGALEAGRTVAVLASGLARAYPPRHTGLFGRIARQGALVSAYEDDAAPEAFRLLERNVLIAAMVKAVVVVQAPARSGALSTATAARDLGRVVLAVPAAPWDPKGEGNLALLGRGALPCRSAQDVGAVLGLSLAATPAPEAQGVVSGLDPEGAEVHAQLGARPRHADELASVMGISAARVQRALMTLVLMGLVEERPGGRYVRSGA